ncbi:MAG: DUF2934 domain-containing protein [Candidatus Solibacter sp.]
MASKRTSENKVVATPSGAAAAPARHKPSSKRITRSTVEVSSTPTTAPEVLTVAAVASVGPLAVSTVSTVSFQDAVARLAYAYWEARGCQGGSPEEDWLRAEQELSAK